MCKRYISQQEGITLIELLAALAITSLIIILSFSVLTSTFKFNDKSQAHINLRQEANILITNIRKHHQKQEAVCYEQLEQLLSNAQILDSTLWLDKKEFREGNCWEPIPSTGGIPDLPVTFTLTDPSQRYQFEIDTIIDGYSRNEISVDIPNQPPVDDNFYEQIKNNNVFIYGSDFGIYGSTPVDNAANQHGTIFISNLNQENLLFTGNNKVSVSNIYINKKGQEIIFRSSTKLGAKNTTDIVRIEGNVQLNNGGARIYANTVYIDGNVTFGSSAIIDAKKVIIIGDVQLNNGGAKINTESLYVDGNVTFGDSAKIEADKVAITGDVTFHNWGASLKANEIYINGEVGTRQPDNIIGNYTHGLVPLNKDDIPKALKLSTPTFHDDSWYAANGYEVRSSGKLSDGSKIYTHSNFTTNDSHENTNNVIIVSKGDINISRFGSSHLTGILFAPQGKVTFNGGGFRGVVIARDGFFTKGNPSITFTNVSEFINNPERAPFK